MNFCGRNEEEGAVHHPGTKRAASPDPSCVSMKSHHSKFEPPGFSNGAKRPRLEAQEPTSPVPSYVSMKSEHSQFEPPSFSEVAKCLGEPVAEFSLCGKNEEEGAVHHPETQRAASPDPSCVSMKSHHSKFEPPGFSNGAKQPRLEAEEPTSPDPSCVSMKSHHSQFAGKSEGSKCPGEPAAEMSLCGRNEEEGAVHHPETQRAASPDPSCVSMKSHHSKFEPPGFSNGAKQPRLEAQEPTSPVPSCVSMKSHHSKFEPPGFSNGAKRPSEPVAEMSLCGRNEEEGAVHHPETQRAASPLPSCLSMKSHHSKFEPPGFSNGAKQPRFDAQRATSEKNDLKENSKPPALSDGAKHSRCGVCSQILRDPPSSSCGHFFCCQCISRCQDQPGSSGDFACPQCRKMSATQPTLQTSENKQQHEQPSVDVLQKVLRSHKTSMKSKYECLLEGIAEHQNRTPLNSIYTQLYIIEGGKEGVNEEHEVLQIEKSFGGSTQGVPVNYSDIFRPLQGIEKETEREHEKMKTVLTKGIAGIGKTVSVQKFVLDWAEGEANQDVDFMFVLPFRELNLIKDDEYSLHGLLCVFHPELKELDPKMYDECKIMFILDGLDESRISLNTNLSGSKKICKVTMKSSVSVLMTNIIRGDLLASALIWITSRPAAASQIPPRYVSRVTEIQGFNDPQKEEYFKKRISDPNQANRVFLQIRKAKTLHIMCHIPIFCWISATVILQILHQNANGEIPTTLTEMYIRFMLIQTKTKKLKYHNTDETKEKEMILKLAELAFKQLLKGNVLFYEEDLRECGIDVTEMSVYSGMCTQIFKEESVLYQRKVYCFVHLSFQEFLAAVFAFHACLRKDAEVKKMFQTRISKKFGRFVDDFMETAMDKALKSTTGHLDLFLRFLFGISQNSNWQHLYHVLPYKCRVTEEFQETIQRVKQKRQKKVSPERWTNFLNCFLEMKDGHFHLEVETLLNTNKKLTQWQCTQNVYTLQMSDQVLDELDLKKYNTSEAGRRRLIPLVRKCRKALLANVSLTKQDCEIVMSALQLTNSTLTELDLSYNDIQDSGVKLLCAGLKSPHCKLEKLRLVLCNLNKQSCEYVASALQSANSSLKELDLSQNDLLDTGVRILSDGLKSPHCQLKTLRLSGCLVTEEGCASLASALSSNPLHLRELDLSYNHPGDLGRELLCAKVKDPTCKLDKLSLDYGGVSTIKPGVRKYAVKLTLDPNTVKKGLVLSEENRKVTFGWENETQQAYPDHPERFNSPQVLCRESLSQRCYWEAEWTGWRAGIAVAYKRPPRRSCTSFDFGSNETSWSLYCYESKHKYSIHYNNKKTFIRAPRSRSNRLGVYLDWRAGTLSFYSVLSDGSTLAHLHTFQCRFTEPLYAGFNVYDSSVSLCHI